MGACATKGNHVRVLSDAQGQKVPDQSDGDVTNGQQDTSGITIGDSCHTHMKSSDTTAEESTSKQTDNQKQLDAPLSSNGSFSDCSSDVDVHANRGNDSPTLMKTQSKLEEASRRRLSVSTVQATPTGGERGLVGTTHVPLVSSTSLEYIPDKSRRSLITKFNDPALQLVDERRGAIREVTVEMLLGLVPDANYVLALFGAPSHDAQSGFDNKELTLSGTMKMKTNLASLGIGYACKKGLKPESPNQDDFFILRVDDWSLYGVFDGHGPSGHDVSNFVHTALPFLIMSDPQFEEDTAATLRRAFRKVHHLLEAAAEQADAYMDCTLSGCTATVVLHRDNKLYIAHVGDSRAVLAQKVDKKVSAVSLTIDHKPTTEAERLRIESHGGEVQRLEGDIPYRVFVKNRMYPGLAMSRAIGDTVGAAVGVISDPDVRIVELQKDNIFLVISTDGVWEFISSQECIDICAKKPRAKVQEAAEALAQESWRRWVEEEESVVDDITCLLVYIGP